ncbi:helix-turn-helix domain-containing protein [Amycolatopsis sp. YIM 10]|uniref:helix-turn-helix domain-containing protein n=1 Tax=Amycolatopsis sp. YIM 10 TaxID=2653857 RepID=UPI0012903A7D|nr:helix-turn-helix transcriptional regulator [Amycolatopsis sp. YIM 10]QFU89379.1 hypothetical protein YIM_21000 [Amycolatopsis sp. YIM 10]
MREALAAREISSVYRQLRRHGVSQRLIAAMTGQSQSEVSEILKGRQVMAYDVLVRIADGLGVARGYMGLAYDEATAIQVVGNAGGQQAEEDESVKRRKFLAHAAQVSMGAAVFGSSAEAWATRPARTPAPGRIGMTDVRKMETASRVLRAMNDQYGREFVRKSVEAQLFEVKLAIDRAESEEVRIRIDQVAVALDVLLAEPAPDHLDASSVPEDDGVGLYRPLSRLPRCTVGWVTHVLPEGERTRYLDECLSELDELAQLPQRRRAQFAYLLNLLVRIPSLRLALNKSTPAGQGVKPVVAPVEALSRVVDSKERTQNLFRLLRLVVIGLAVVLGEVFAFLAFVSYSPMAGMIIGLLTTVPAAGLAIKGRRRVRRRPKRSSA